MSERKICEFKNEENGLFAAVKYNSDYREFRVKMYENGHRTEARDYFTNDKTDAINTAKLMLKIAL